MCQRRGNGEIERAFEICDEAGYEEFTERERILASKSPSKDVRAQVYSLADCGHLRVCSSLCEDSICH